MKRAVLRWLKPTAECLPIRQTELRKRILDVEFDPVTADAKTRRNLAIRHPVLYGMRDSPFSRRKNVVVGPPSSSPLTCHKDMLALAGANFPPPL